MNAGFQNAGASARARPLLSVVVAIASDTTRPADTRQLEPCVEALCSQPDRQSMEIIVPHPPGMAGVGALRRRHPGVRFLEIRNLHNYNGRGNSREHHGELISRGFGEARGSLVALIEDNDVPAPHWSSCMIQALGGAFAAVGGAIENGIDRPLNWAVYFCDFLRYQNPLPEGESARASDANSAYRRAALEEIRDVWKDEYHEASINRALLERGHKIALVHGAVVYQRRLGLKLAPAMRERFVWGRSFGSWRIGQAGAGRRLFWTVFSPALPLLLLARMTVMAARKRRTLGAFLKALPLTALLVTGWVCGELTGYLTGRATAASFSRLSPEARRAQAVS